MTSKIFKIKSPAKINIGLHVKGRRKDGYHNIETVFYPIPLYDEIKIYIRKTGGAENLINVRTNSGSAIDGRRNICHRAAEMFLDEFRVKDKYRIDISIKKKIPIGAGLGGGSSDAAAVLKVLSKYFKKESSVAKIENTALRLGSDVPFFLYGKPAFAALRGEKLNPLPGFEIKYHILLVNPNIHVSTKWAYGKLNIKDQKAKSKNTKERKLSEIKGFNLTDMKLFKNDFEKVVFAKYPAIGKIKQRMYETGAVFSSMSGSGSTVYGFYENGINSAARQFSQKGYKVYRITARR